MDRLKKIAMLSLGLGFLFTACNPALAQAEANGFYFKTRYNHRVAPEMFGVGFWALPEVGLALYDVPEGYLRLQLLLDSEYLTPFVAGAYEYGLDGDSRWLLGVGMRFSVGNFDFEPGYRARR